MKNTRGYKKNAKKLEKLRKIYAGIRKTNWPWKTHKAIKSKPKLILEKIRGLRSPSLSPNEKQIWKWDL